MMNFQLIESMLWTPEEGFFLLDQHWRRLARSAAYFQIPLSKTAVYTSLNRWERRLSQRSKVRLLVDKQGSISLQDSLIIQDAVHPVRVRIGMAVAPIDSTNPLLTHKTTNRHVYEAARAVRPDCEEVVLWNERGEITESERANVVVRLNDELITPPLSCGLLPGTFRAFLLENGRIQERVISKADLQQSQQIFLINSVRKWREAVL